MSGRLVSEYEANKINNHVPNMQYHSAVVLEGPTQMPLGAPVAADPNGILAAQSIDAAGSATTFASTYSSDNMARCGRNVVVTCSAVGTPKITIHGRDYLGQPMTEEITANGTTPVPGVKAFKYIEEVIWEALASQTLDVGWQDVLGLEFKTHTVISELEDGAAATAGTFVAGSNATQTATSADPRGTYNPNTACDGTTTFELYTICDADNLHGTAHFNSF